MFITFININFEIVYLSGSQPGSGVASVVYFCFYLITGGPTEIASGPQRVL